MRGWVLPGLPPVLHGSTILLDSGVPVFAVRPSSSAVCRDGSLVRLETGTIQQALEEHLVPLVHGDVALDEVRGGTIISTEEIMAYLAPELKPRRILLLGATEGVLQGGERDGWIGGDVLPLITPSNVETIATSLGAARGRDVTGGMLSKVFQMLAIVQTQPELYVHILNGLQPGLLTRALVEPDLATGTRIMSN
jgi:isopentenyl phosphate kinase